jgi:ligand-binding sensor domain-containing protein/serine phosphatase RsbU (regulator of sigma subunit)
MRKSIKIIFLLLLAWKLEAQHYNISRYSVREGLLHSFVSDLTQDKRGNLWIATGAGLCQFNGVQFNYFTTKDGLNNTRLTCLAADDQGNIWTGSSRGVNIFDGKTIYSLVDSAFGENVLAIKTIEGANAWVATDKGLSIVSFIYGKINFDKIKYDFSSPELAMIFQDRSLTSFLLASKTGDLFYGSNGFLFRIQNKIIENITVDDGVTINSGTELHDGTLLFATNKGIFRLKNSALVPFENKYTQSYNLSRIQYHGQKLWMLGQNEGQGNEEMFLLVIDLNDPSYFRMIGKRNGLIESPTSLYIDHENNVWTGSNGGLSVLRGETFMTFTIADGLTGNKVWGICQTDDKNMWIGTIGEGLTIKNENITYNYTKANGLPDMYVGKIYQDQQKNIYIGTVNAGICKVFFDVKTNKHFFRKLIIIPGNERIRVDDICRDSENRLWVASQKGLYYTSNERNFFHTPLFEEDTGQVFVQKIHLDKVRDRIWIGTRNNGVFYIENSIAYRCNEIPYNEEVTTIIQDSFGDLWIGTRTRGIYRIGEKELTQFTDRNGLTSNLIYILFPDSHGNLWIGTNLGLDKLNLNALREGKTELRHYNSADGLLDLETNLNGVIEDEKGFIWFATNGGLLRYDQKFDISNRIPPKVNLLNLKLHSRETDWSKYSSKVDLWNGLPKKLTLKYNQNHLTFDFVAISFKNPKEIIYSWKLEGFDHSWVQGEANRQAIYSNLPSGRYIFKLKAANNDKIWSDEIQTISFTISPPVWGTWWFKLMALVIFFLLIYLFLLSRTKSLKIRQKELQEIVDQRTKEISEQLRIIDKKSHQILDSISYAKFLQNAILPSISTIDQVFSDVLILYKPKDVVSGDFYWFQNEENKSIIAVADCTGHGVPGAIVSVVCSNALNQAVRDYPNADPAQILERTRTLVIDTFSHGYEDVRDGMDIALVVFDHQSGELTFSGANSGLCAVINNEFVKLKPNIQHIGRNIKTIPFTNQTLQLQLGDLFFMSTDGYTDQLGGHDRHKFSMKRLEHILFKNAQLKLGDLAMLLDETLYNWKGHNEQTDDVLVMGIRF